MLGDRWAPRLENLTLVITVVAGVGMTSKLLDPALCFGMWCVGYSIATLGAHFRRNRRNVFLFTFLALNTGYGAINWMV